MTTQQQTPQTEQPQDLAFRVGRIEGLIEMVIEQQRVHTEALAATNARIDATNARIDRLMQILIAAAVAFSVGAIASVVTLVITPHRPPHPLTRDAPAQAGTPTPVPRYGAATPTVKAHSRSVVLTTFIQ